MVCGVYGPVEVRAARERCDRAVLEVVVRGETGLPTGRERQLEQLLAGCCAECIRVELHPHTAISVTVQVESNDGSVCWHYIYNALTSLLIRLLSVLLS